MSPRKKKPTPKPKALSADWRAVRPKPKPKLKGKAKEPVKPSAVGYPEDVMTDWAVLSGKNLPKYAYYIEWDDPALLALHRLRVLGKRTHNGCPGFVVKLDKTLFADEGWERNDCTPSRGGRILARTALCFSRLEVERGLTNRSSRHLNHVWEAAKRLRSMLEDLTRSAEWFESMMLRMRGTYRMSEAIEAIPAKIERA